MQNNNYSVYIFGTPKNCDGFEHKCITYNDLIQGEYGQYLDKFDSNTMSEGYTYNIKKESIDNNQYTFLSLFRKLNVENDRGGAYIAIGIVVSGDISLNDSILFYQIISEIYAHLSAYMTKENRFADGFKLENYSYSIDKSIDIIYLVDTLSIIAHNKQKSEISYNSKKNTLTTLEQEIQKLKEENIKLENDIQDLKGSLKQTSKKTTNNSNVSNKRTTSSSSRNIKISEYTLNWNEINKYISDYKQYTIATEDDLNFVIKEASFLKLLDSNGYYWFNKTTIFDKRGNHFKATQGTKYRAIYLK